jgi:hypothetical protein
LLAASIQRSEFVAIGFPWFLRRQSVALDSDLIEEGKDLLHRAVKDPFDQIHPGTGESETHVRDWFEFLIKHFPLWSLNKLVWRRSEWASEDGLPSPTPRSLWLKKTLEALLRDDGLTPFDDRGCLVPHFSDKDQLRAAVNSRRVALTDGESPTIGALWYLKESA